MVDGDDLIGCYCLMWYCYYCHGGMMGRSDWIHWYVQMHVDIPQVAHRESVRGGVVMMVIVGMMIVVVVVRQQDPFP